MSDKSPATRSERPVFWEAIRSALGLFSVWLFVGLALALPPLALASGWLGWLGDTIGERYAKGELVPNLDEIFRHDHSEGLASLSTSTANAVAILGLFSIMGGVLCAGGWLQVFLERRQDRPLRRFFFGSGRYFFRFLRLAFVVLGCLALVNWIVFGWPWERFVDGALLGLEDGEVEELASERAVVWRTWAQSLAGFAALGAILVWAKYTRTRLALNDTTSVCMAGLSAAWMLVCHPLRTLRPALLIFGVDALVLLALGAISSLLSRGLDEQSTWWPVALLFTLSLAALLAREILRGAYYAATMQVTTQLVGRPSRSDPQSLGGPGGPRYPLDADGDDPYGVSL